jgi:hypothetical protein
VQVSENKRFLVHEDGTPFFYLGDTAWELLHHLKREEAEGYLENRRQKGLTVIQAVVLIEEGAGGKHLMTARPMGGHSSPERFHEDTRLDSNMLRSGRSQFDLPDYERITVDYNRRPVKPCMDREFRYENHPVNWNPKNGWFDDFDVRRAAYRGLFAGGYGHTYECHDIWQMMGPGRQPISFARNYWYDVLDLPGAWDMMHVVYF